MDNVPWRGEFRPIQVEYWRWSLTLSGGVVGETVMSGFHNVGWPSAPTSVSSYTVPANKYLIVTNITTHMRPPTAVGAPTATFRIRQGTTTGGNGLWQMDVHGSHTYGAPATGEKYGSDFSVPIPIHGMKIGAGNQFCVTCQRSVVVTCFMHMWGYMAIEF